MVVRIARRLQDAEGPAVSYAVNSLRWSPGTIARIHRRPGPAHPCSCQRIAGHRLYGPIESIRPQVIRWLISE